MSSESLLPPSGIPYIGGRVCGCVLHHEAVLDYVNFQIVNILQYVESSLNIYAGVINWSSILQFFSVVYNTR